METIDKLLSELETEVMRAKRAAFSASDVVLNKSRLLELISGIRNNMPQAIKEANQIIDQRDNYIANAQNFAGSIVQDAQNQAAQLVATDAITQQASAAAAAKIDEAERYCDAMYMQVNSRAIATYQMIEKTLMEALEATRQNLQEFNYNPQGAGQ